MTACSAAGLLLASFFGNWRARKPRLRQVTQQYKASHLWAMNFRLHPERVKRYRSGGGGDRLEGATNDRGQNRKTSERAQRVRFAPDSRHGADIAGGCSWAIFGIMRGKKTLWRSARSGRRAADQPHRTAQAHTHTVRIGRQRLAERGDGGRDDLY